MRWFGWHHRLNGYELEQALVDGEGRGSLACCSPCGCKESDTTEQLNNKDVFLRWNLTEKDQLVLVRRQ